MIIAGADPGITGAIAITDDGTDLLNVFDMPTVLRGQKTMVCVDSVAEILISEKVDILVVEQVGASPHMGVSGAFNFGASFYGLIGVAAGCQIPSYTITPQKWKTYHGLIKKAKGASLTRATSMVSSEMAQKYFRLKKHTDRAEAFLLANCWATVFMQDQIEGD